MRWSLRLTGSCSMLTPCKKRRATTTPKLQFPAEEQSPRKHQATIGHPDPPAKQRGKDPMPGSLGHAVCSHFQPSGGLGTTGELKGFGFLVSQCEVSLSQCWPPGRGRPRHDGGPRHSR